jgi:hypothetical protein
LGTGHSNGGCTANKDTAAAVAAVAVGMGTAGAGRVAVVVVGTGGEAAEVAGDTTTTLKSRLSQG